MSLRRQGTYENHTGWRAARREAALMGGGLLGYQASRLLGGHDVRAARLNSGRLRELQRALELPSESAVQDGLLEVEGLVVAANAYYAAAHLPGTALALLWLLLRRTAHYRCARQALLLSTGAALILYVLFPVAPPRMLAGFTSLRQHTAPDGVGTDRRASPREPPRQRRHSGVALPRAGRDAVTRSGRCKEHAEVLPGWRRRWGSAASC